MVTLSMQLVDKAMVLAGGGQCCHPAAPQHVAWGKCSSGALEVGRLLSDTPRSADMCKQTADKGMQREADDCVWCSCSQCELEVEALLASQQQASSGLETGCIAAEEQLVGAHMF